MLTTTIELKNLDTEKVKELLEKVLISVRDNETTQFTVSLLNLASLVQKNSGVSYTEHISHTLGVLCRWHNRVHLHYKLKLFFENDNTSVIKAFQKVVEQIENNTLKAFKEQDKENVFLFLGFCGLFVGSLKLPMLLSVSGISNEISLEILRNFAKAKQSFFYLLKDTK